MVNAGLPNITGVIASKNTGDNFPLITDKFSEVSGVFSIEGQGVKRGMAIDGGTKWGCDTLNFNASKSNSIYGSSDTVTPLTYTVRAYICYA